MTWQFFLIKELEVAFGQSGKNKWNSPFKHQVSLNYFQPPNLVPQSDFKEKLMKISIIKCFATINEHCRFSLPVT